MGHAGVVSAINKKIYAAIQTWRNRPIEGEHPYVYLDGIVLLRSSAGKVRDRRRTRPAEAHFSNSSRLRPGILPRRSHRRALELPI
jgi:hypothetical protein